MRLLIQSWGHHQLVDVNVCVELVYFNLVFMLRLCLVVVIIAVIAIAIFPSHNFIVGENFSKPAESHVRRYNVRQQPTIFDA